VQFFLQTKPAYSFCGWLVTSAFVSFCFLGPSLTAHFDQTKNAKKMDLEAFVNCQVVCYCEIASEQRARAEF
jgi:hypothetical protein